MVDGKPRSRTHIYREPTEAIIHNNYYTPLLKNNRCAPLSEDDEDNKDNEKITGVEDKGTGLDSNDYKSTGVKSESTGITE